jgi:transposase
LARTFKKARVLLLMDAGHTAPSAARAAGVDESTARRVGERYNSYGLELAIFDKPRPGGERLLDKRQETAIVAMVCSKPPEGFARWSISLIARESTRRGIVPSIGETTVRRLLERHELKPWREKNVVRSGD